METEWHFDFGVYPLTEEQASALMERIVELVNDMGCSVGGGPRPYQEGEDGPDAERD